MTYSPWRHVGTMPEIEVWCGDALEHAEAYWEPDHQVILLDRRLGQAARRARLAHEIAHIDRGDECVRDTPDAARLNSRQEARADALAARRLLSLDFLADALVWCPGYDELAEHLHVDETTVRARIRGLTDAEKKHIAERIAARGDAA